MGQVSQKPCDYVSLRGGDIAFAHEIKIELTFAQAALSQGVEAEQKLEIRPSFLQI